MFKKKRNIISRFASAGVMLIGVFLGNPLFADAEVFYIAAPPPAWELEAEHEMFAKADRAREKSTVQETPFTAQDYQKIKEEVSVEHEQLVMETELFEKRITAPPRPIFRKEPPLLLAHTPMDSPVYRAGGGSGGSAVATGPVNIVARTITQKIQRAPGNAPEQLTVRTENRTIQNYYSIKNGYISGERRVFIQKPSSLPLIAHLRTLKSVFFTNSYKKLIKNPLPNVLTGKTGPLV